jgi:hypothetical protein
MNKAILTLPLLLMLGACGPKVLPMLPAPPSYDSCFQPNEVPPALDPLPDNATMGQLIEAITTDTYKYINARDTIKADNEVKANCAKTDAEYRKTVQDLNDRVNRRRR